MSDVDQAVTEVIRDMSCAGFDVDSPDTIATHLIARLDKAGYRIVGARTGTLAGSRSTDVSLAQYQQILGERNRLQADLDAMPAAQACGCHLAEACTYHASVKLPRVNAPGAQCPLIGCQRTVNADGSTDPCGYGGCPLGGDF